ncbi:MAG: hypothetical protein AB1757_10950 [Acidobacteriota bacterium]
MRIEKRSSFANLFLPSINERKIMSEQSLKFLHSEKDIAPLKLEMFRKLSTQELIESLRPGEEGSLKTRPDGTVLDGHHRLIILREREIDIHALPREILEKDSPMT